MRKIIQTIFNIIFDVLKTILLGGYRLCTIILNIVLYIIDKSNKLLDKTNHKWLILSSFFGVFLFTGWILTHQRFIKLMVFDVNIYFHTKENKALANQTKTTRIEFDKSLNNMFYILNKFIVDNKNYCIQNNLLKYKKIIRNQNKILSDEIIPIIELDLIKNECNIKKFKDLAYNDIMKGIPNEYKDGIFQKVENDIQKKEIKIIKNKEQEVKKIQNNITKKDLNLINGISTFKNSKFNGKIKAIFCVIGHGKSKEGWLDRGFVMYNTNPNFKKMKSIINQYGFEYIKKEVNKDEIFTERNILEMIGPSTCDNLDKLGKKNGIKVYKIGLEKESLINKIKKVNEISNKNGYNEKNSLLISLHSNSVIDEKRSGLEVFYGQLETKNHGFQGEEFAGKVLFGLNKLHNFGNHYQIKSDIRTRHGHLGIISNTKPLSILIEYGFKNNVNDMKFAIVNYNKVGKSIADSVFSFIKG